MSAEIKIDTGEFRRTLAEYIKVSKRALPVVLDTKGFYIARGAVRETKAPTKAKILSELRADRWNLAHHATLEELIVTKRALFNNGKGLNKTAMKRAISKLEQARVRSINFIRSGWITSIKTLEPFAEKKNNAPSRVPGVKQIGQAKGSAKAATPRSGQWVVSTTITNSASSQHDRKGALEKYGMPGFERAWNAEISSMKSYIERKMQDVSDPFITKKH